MSIAHEPRAALAAPENDLAVMKVRELCAMADADDCRVFELPRQQLHHSILAHSIERSGRLVEHDDIGAMQQDPRERQPLSLLSPILAHHTHCRARIQFTISVGSQRFAVHFETGIYSRVDGSLMAWASPSSKVGTTISGLIAP
jgi:hypothetical protein